MTTSIEQRIADAERMLRIRGQHLYPYQIDGARWLYECAQRGEQSLLGDEMGLGKTYQAIVASDPDQPILVECPSGVKFPWALSFRTLRPASKISIIESKAAWRFPRPSEVLVAGWEILPPGQRECDRLTKEIADAGGPAAAPGLQSKLNRMLAIRRGLRAPHPNTLIIADEAHRARNPDAAITGRFREVSVHVREHGGFVWTLTGTPLMNHLDELWVILQANGLGTRAFAPRPDATAREARGQFDIDALFPGRIAEKLRTVMLRRERAQVLPQLPEKTHEVVEVELDADTRKLADDVVLGLRAIGVDIATATLDALQTAALKSIERERMSELRAKLATAKIPAMLDLVEDLELQGVPVVVFADHRAALNHLARRDGWAKVTGEETAEQKQEAVEAFQAGKLRGIAVSIRAGGVGITLTHAWRAIFVDLPWVPALVSQAEDRLCRIGQTARGLLYTRLVAAHVLERRIEALLEAKQKTFDENVGAASVPGRVEA